MNIRQARLLEAIIDQFISTAVPVGSKRLIEAGIFTCSPATIRNEMALLEDEGYLQQPHVSAGRIPTAKGYRAYVQDFMAPSAKEKEVRRKFDTLRQRYFHRKDQERAYEAVALLSHMTPHVAFATVPHKDRVYYLGLRNVLREPEFQQDPTLGSGVAEVLEERLHEVLHQVPVDEKIRTYIGEEHVLSELLSCSLMVTAYRVRDHKGAIGVLGPMRMDYLYNSVALDMVSDLLRKE